LYDSVYLYHPIIIDVAITRNFSGQLHVMMLQDSVSCDMMLAK